MRLRWQRRVRKQLKGTTLLRDVTMLERQGMTLMRALAMIVVRPGHGHLEEGVAGKLLSIAGNSHAVDALLGRIFSLTDKDDLYVAALRLERLNDRRARCVP